MKATVYREKHIERGAKMVPFAGFEMPLEYSGIRAEHMAVRERVGVFDVSHMGEFIIKGENALPFIQYVTSNDASLLFPGKVQYSCFPNGRGGIVDDLVVYCFGKEAYMMVVNAANTDKDFAHLTPFAQKFGLEVGKDFCNVSDRTAQLAVQGPKAMEVMQRLCKESITDMEYYTFKRLNLAGKEVLLSTTGYTGAGGCEIYMSNEDALAVWDAVFEAGAPENIIPAGLGCRDTLRLEMGFCLYGNDIDDTTSPLEANLAWITKFNDVKGDFLDRDYMLKQKEEGLRRRLCGFELIERGVPRHGYEICDADGNRLGSVTSGGISPSTGKAIGLGYVATPLYKIGSEIYIKVRDHLLKATVVKPPFYQAQK